MHQARHRSGLPAWSVRSRALAAVAVAAAGLAVAVWLPSRNDAASAQVQAASGPGVFADDFGCRNGGADPAKWSPTGTGTGTACTQPADGRLVLKQQLRSRQSFTGRFGHAEARIRVSCPTELWRGFTLTDQSGWLLLGRFEMMTGGIDPTPDSFHTYTIDWTPETVVWSVDGTPGLRLIRSAPGRPVTLMLNLSGGRFPCRMEVDFVRAATADDASPVAIDPPTPSGPTPGDPQSPSPRPPGSPRPTASPTPEARAWKAYTDYTVGDLVAHEGVTYRVLEAHTSLPDWEPPTVPALFKKV